jgi:hypothetical protein
VQYAGWRREDGDDEEMGLGVRRQMGCNRSASYELRDEEGGKYGHRWEKEAMKRRKKNYYY